MAPQMLELEPETSNPEDVLFDSLQTLYEYRPITLTAPGATYIHEHRSNGKTTTVTLQTPDPEAANWDLHASSVWVASTQLAGRLEHLQLDQHIRRIQLKAPRNFTILELGAAAGLPGILLAKLYPDITVLATDYPDENLIRTLEQNVARNDVQRNCHTVAYAWGSDPSSLFKYAGQEGFSCRGFDVIIAADTLWNPDLHGIFIDTLRKTLLKDPDARIHLVAGLHTGRYTIESFLCAIRQAGFRIVRVFEQEVTAKGSDGSSSIREWDITRAESEEEKDRRKWAIWIEVCWEEDQLSG